MLDAALRDNSVKAIWQRIRCSERYPGWKSCGKSARAVRRVGADVTAQSAEIPYISHRSGTDCRASCSWCSRSAAVPGCGPCIAGVAVGRRKASGYGPFKVVLNLPQGSRARVFDRFRTFVWGCRSSIRYPSTPAWQGCGSRPGIQRDGSDPLIRMVISKSWRWCLVGMAQGSGEAQASAAPIRSPPSRGRPGAQVPLTRQAAALQRHTGTTSRQPLAHRLFSQIGSRVARARPLLP